MNTRFSDTMRGVIWMAASTVFFSLMAMLVRIADQVYGISAWKSSEFRFVISIIVLLLISVWKHDPLRFVNRRWLFSRGFFGGAAVCIYFYSINHIGLAKAAIFIYSYPLWAGLFSPVLLKDRISPGLWAAVLAACAGLYLVIVPEHGIGSISWLDLLALSGGLLTGWAILSVKKLHATDSSRAIIFSQCFFGLLIVGVPAQAGGYAFPAPAWIVLLGVGLCAAVAQLQMTYAYKFIGAMEGSLLSVLTPVINVGLGMLIFHEPVTARTLIGCAIVLASCTYATIPLAAPEDGAGV